MTSSRRLLAVDVDGTLVGHGRPVGSDLLEDLNRLVEGGDVLVVATGRGPVNTRELARVLHPDTYLVLHNGASTWEKRGRRLAHTAHLSPQAARTAMDILGAHALAAIWVETPLAGGRYLVDHEYLCRRSLSGPC